MLGKSRKIVSKKDNKAAINSDSFIVVNKEKKKIRKPIDVKKIAVCVFLILLVITLIFGLRFVSLDITEMIWKATLTKGSSDVNNKSIRYASFKNGLFRISNDGITYIDSSGKTRFSISYNMTDTIYESNDKYFAIANRNSFEFYIFDDKGVVGKNTATFPIQNISLSKTGILYVLMNDENSSYINLYRANGNKVDISIKNNFTGDGMPIDISTSPDGTELLVDYTCLSDNHIYSKASYYNFDEVGKNANARRIVGEIIDELSDKFLARVHFFDNERSVLVYDGGIIFVSTANLVKPKVIEKIDFDSMIKSISYSDKCFAVVTEDNKLILYDKNGNMKASRQLGFDYENFYLSDDYVVFLNNNRAIIYDSNGRIIFDKELAMNVQYIAKKKSLFFTELLLGLVDGVECIRFY